jgi:hypothetical protein
MFLQESRLKAMENELAKIKKARDEAELAKKYGEERFHKFKNTANKETAATKKTLNEKEKTVVKLKTELKKNESAIEQKMKELR